MKTRRGKLRILIADDHEVVRQGLRRILGTRPEWEICGEAADGREAVKMARRLRPDVVLLDLSMPEISGLAATQEIRKALPETEVLILTMHDSEQLIREGLAAGARGFLLKTDPAAVLLTAVESVSWRQPFFSPNVGNMIVRGFLAPPPQVPSPLTQREQRVLKLVAEGMTSKQIAHTLGLSLKTVETHRTNLMRKLNLHSVSAVVRYALSQETSRI